MSKKYPDGCGVYMATMPSGAFYVGRSINIYQRICNHYSDAKRGAHKNRWLARCLNKYGQRVKWVVLLHCATEQDALAYEKQYLEFWWGSEKLINQKKGDAFTALENERSKRKPVYAMNVWSGLVMRLNYVSEWGSMIGSHRGAKIPCAVYGESIEECNQKRLKKIRHDISRHCATKYKGQEKRKLSGYHLRNIHTGYVGYASSVSKLESIGALKSLYSTTNSFQNGWQVRKIGADWQWFVPSVHAVAVYGLHVTGLTKKWKSRNDCERDLGRGAGNVFTGSCRTYKGWCLRDKERYP